MSLLVSLGEIEVVGSGEVGDKARQLQEKTMQLRSIGFHTPRRVVLAENYFDVFFQRNDLGNSLRDVRVSQDLEQKIRAGSLTSEEFATLQNVVGSFSEPVLAVRSSAAGDSRGTGIYTSDFTVNNIGRVRRSVQKVLASYFSKDAVAFRRDARTGEGFGIIIEPLIADQVDKDRWKCSFAPVLSGFGYTSTSSGEGYVAAVPGLGGGVFNRFVQRITRSMIEKYDNLGDFIWEERKNIGYGGEKDQREIALLGTDFRFRLIGDGLEGEAYHTPTPWDRRGGVMSMNLFPRDRYGESDDSGRQKRREELFNLNLLSLFNMMKAMEDKFGKAQYFEWAMTFENGQPKYWITQIADVDKKLDIMDFNQDLEVLLECHTVLGSGQRTSDKIVICWNPEEIEGLCNFNEENQGYVLLYGGRLISKGTGLSIPYSFVSNALALIEIPDSDRTGHPASHWGGQLRESDKFFGVVEYYGDHKPQFDKIQDLNNREHGLCVYNNKVKIIASERQNRMIVYALK